jgi:hypothetical protein
MKGRIHQALRDTGGPRAGKLAQRVEKGTREQGMSFGVRTGSQSSAPTTTGRQARPGLLHESSPCGSSAPRPIRSENFINTPGRSRQLCKRLGRNAQLWAQAPGENGPPQQLWPQVGFGQGAEMPLGDWLSGLPRRDGRGPRGARA